MVGWIAFWAVAGFSVSFGCFWWLLQLHLIRFEHKP